MTSTDLEEEAAADMMCRASCGISDVDDVKLKECADSDLVRYCSDKCQQEHLLDLKAAPLLCLALVLLLIFNSLLWKKFHGGVHGGDNKMSADEAADMMSCASCGTAEVDDDIKLKKCGDCELVQYCSDICQQEHRLKHEQACKERVAKLRDETLLRQPESTHFGDCPICFLPLPIDVKKSTLMGCCSKAICDGCAYANMLRQQEDRLEFTCPFCRHPIPTTREESDQNKLKRLEKNNPVAMWDMGSKHYHEGDFESAFKYCSKAAELGDVVAHYNISIFYREGEGVEKDEKKELYHLEEASIAGHPHARFNLGFYEEKNDRMDRAAKHFIIAANLGHDDSIKRLKRFYVRGDVSKEDFATALRAHHAAVDATKSAQREAAAKAEATGEMLKGK